MQLTDILTQAGGLGGNPLDDILGMASQAMRRS